jgi:hypothetical protein
MHEHEHDHDHRHHDVAEVRARPVALDLGGDRGALIVYTDPELLGLEIEISPAADDADRQHKQVLRRSLGAGVSTCLVYDNLAEGAYTLWLEEGAVRDVHVTGGSVTELDRRETAAAAPP